MPNPNAAALSRDCCCESGGLYISNAIADGGHLTDSTSASAPHRRTRHDHATETAEDYVEAVAEIIDEHGSCRLKDLAARFGVSHVTANRIVARLVGKELLTTEPYRPIELTTEGRELAEKCRQRHETVYQFLLSIGVDEQTAAIDAEGIEHHVSSKTLARFRHIIDAHK